MERADADEEALESPSTPDAGGEDGSVENSLVFTAVEPPRFALVVAKAGRALAFFSKGWNYEGTGKRESIGRMGLAGVDLGALPERPAYTVLAKGAAGCVAHATRALYVEGSFIVPRGYEGELAFELEGCEDLDAIQLFAVQGAHTRSKESRSVVEKVGGARRARDRLGKLAPAAVAPAGRIERLWIARFADSDIQALVAVDPRPCCGTPLVEVFLVRNRELLDTFRGFSAWDFSADLHIVGGRPLLVIRDYRRIRVVSLRGKRPTLFAGSWPVVDCEGC